MGVRFGIASTCSPRREVERDRGETMAQLEAHRKPLVEAAVMRVMKSRRRMDHNALVADVTQQLAPHFQVQPARIKQCLESLIEVRAWGGGQEDDTIVDNKRVCSLCKELWLFGTEESRGGGGERVEGRPFVNPWLLRLGLQREYLERDKDDRRMYMYIS